MISLNAVRAALIGAALAMLATRVPAVELSMPDTTFSASDTLRIPINVDSITSPGVLAYQFVLTFDSMVLVGVGADAQGTITEPFGDPFTSGGTIGGQLRLAAAGIDTVWGTGPFIILLLRAASDTGGITFLRFESAMLNEGAPSVTYPDTLATVTVQGLSAADPRQPWPPITNISVSPNPSHGFITLNLPVSKKPLQVRLWNVLGQQVVISDLVGARKTLNLSYLPDGAYFITIDQRPELIARFYLLR